MSKLIFVVDDNTDILDLYDAVFSSEGYKVKPYSVATDDMALIENEKPDLFIIDHMFGDEAMGWKFIEKMRSQYLTATTPAIVCTAEIRRVQQLESQFKAKNVDVVLKPFDIDDLVRTVKTALNNLPNTSPQTSKELNIH